VSEFHVKVPQATGYRNGFERTTLRTKGDESTNEQPSPTDMSLKNKQLRYTLP